MADLELTTTATITASTSVNITVYEDVGNTGSGSFTDPNGKPYDNSATQSIDNGTNSYLLSGFDASFGNAVWAEIEIDNTDKLQTATLDSSDVQIDIIIQPLSETFAETEVTKETKIFNRVFNSRVGSVILKTQNLTKVRINQEVVGVVGRIDTFGSFIKRLSERLGM